MKEILTLSSVTKADAARLVQVEKVLSYIGIIFFFLYSFANFT